MSGVIGKSDRIEIIPVWFIMPCCMLTPSMMASSPVCKPPLMRAPKGSPVPPVVTPGIRMAKVAEERTVPATCKGSSCSVSREMPPFTSGVSKLTGEASPTTSMISTAVPSCISTSNRATSFISSEMPACTKSLNPGTDTLNSYTPGIMFAKVYRPDSLLLVRRTALVCREVSVISTPGMTAPWGSITVPLSVAVVFCAHAAGTNKSVRHITVPHSITRLNMVGSSVSVVGNVEIKRLKSG